MFKPVVVMLECTASVVRRINVDALDFARELLLKCFEGEQVVAEDEAIIEDVVVGDSMRGMVSLSRVLQQNARLQLRPVLLPDPGKLEFRLLISHCAYSPPTTLAGVATGEAGTCKQLFPHVTLTAFSMMFFRLGGTTGGLLEMSLRAI